MNGTKVFVTAFKVLTVALMFSLSACDSPIFDPIEPGGGGGGGEKPPVITDCRVSGTMVRVPCGESIYDNLWIRTDDGKLLQPCKQSFVTLCPLLFDEGDRVKLSYRKLSKSEGCGDAYKCMTPLPEYKQVIIDCIMEQPGSNDCQALIKDNLGDPVSNVNILDAEISGNNLKVRVGYSGCSEKPASFFKLTWGGYISKSNPSQTTLYLSNTSPEMCQAYFTRDLCFDISAIKSSFPGTVVITLGDKKITY